MIIASELEFDAVLPGSVDVVDSVSQVINPLGLFDDRLKSLTALTTHFFAHDKFELSLDPKSPHKVHGIGPFGYESYLVFCKDQGPTITLSQGGKPIQPFVSWRKKHEASQDGNKE